MQTFGYEVPKGFSTQTTKYVNGTEWRRGERTFVTLTERPNGRVQFTYYTPSGRRMDEYGEEGYRKSRNNIRAVDLYEAKVSKAQQEMNARRELGRTEINTRFGTALTEDDGYSEYMKGDDVRPGHRVDYRLHADEINICIDLMCISNEQVTEILAILRK